MIPRSSASKNKCSKLGQLATSIWSALKPNDLKNIAQKIKEKFEWNHEPRPFQVDAIVAQLKREDVLIHAGTGSGKTAVAAGPHAHEKMKGKVTFMISPLIALQDEQVKTFREEFKLEAVAVNSAHGGCTKEIMADITAGKWQIVVISPEMVLSKRFINNVIRKPEMSRRVLSVVVDEAHVVSHWGSGFRKKYGTLGVLRALLPKGTPFVAMSATLPERVRKDVLVKLQFDRKRFTYLNLGNDRPNVSLVVRAIQNPMNTYSDLDFLIPRNIRNANEVRKGFVYADNVSGGLDMVDYIDGLLPMELQGRGIVRPYNAALSKECRDLVMDLFKAGIVRILVCTDAAGMGCNIPDIDIVVQWKLPATVSAFVQRAGRAARGSGRNGLAVLLVEKTIYDADLGSPPQHDQKSKGKKTIWQSSNYPKAKTKDYAIKHGVLRGAYGGVSEQVVAGIDVPVDVASADEGIYGFVQAMTCRRGVLTKIYGNEKAAPTVPCCDICNPELLNLTRPAAPQPTARKSTVLYEAVNPATKSSLEEWRTRIWNRDFQDAIFSPVGILSDAAIEKLSSVASPIENLISLERALGGGWAWFGTYGDELLTEIKSLPFKSMGPKPKQKRGAKRTVVDVADEESVSKRTRVDIDATLAPAPTPVRLGSLSTTSHSSPAIGGPTTPSTFRGYQYPSPHNFTPMAQYHPNYPYPTPPHTYTPIQPFYYPYYSMPGQPHHLPPQYQPFNPNNPGPSHS
ncbi:P-loop containing nucleoside triphosphate hydrolase protein [Pholiota molesta]|nr:P-loop containing nucleoside triphosphate hydrolase protein [Pholiota molesta]